MAVGIRVGLTYGAMSPSRDDDREDLLAFAQQVEALGFSTLWMPSEFSWDVMVALSAVVDATDRLELGSTALPIFSRHPVLMAQEALSLSTVCGGRFTLGLGLSHKMIVEEIMGLSYDRPVAHMEEYLSVLVPLLNRELSRHQGERYRVSVELSVPGEYGVPLVVSASGRHMLKLAGQYADGVHAWLVGIRSFQSHVMPCLTRAADEMNRKRPRVIVGLPIAITDDVARLKQQIDTQYEFQGLMPSHRSMLDREGAERVSDIALVGSEDEVEEKIRAFAEAGMTDFNGSIVGSDEEALARTFDFLGQRF